VLTDLVAAVLAHALDAEAALTPETRTRELLLRIKDFIGRNLHDPELTPSRIAAAHHISAGYLHRLFRAETGTAAETGTGAAAGAETETVASYIRHQRLEGARRDLADPALTGTPIHVIGARWGFPRATDFTRAFRAGYGIPPNDYRHQAANPVH
jgi:AraC-like DNA-binding protein